MNIQYRDLIMIGIATFLFAVVTGPFIVMYLRRIKAGATVRSEGPEAHLKKTGTPLMGGFVFVLPIMGAAIYLVWWVGANVHMVAGILILMLGLGSLGFIDDYLKVVKKRSLGLSARDKLVGQTLVVVVFLTVFSGYSIDTWVTLPYWGTTWDLGYAYLPFLLLLVMGTSNAVNITDGVDGLLSGSMIFSCLSYMFIALVRGQPEVAGMAAATMGGLLGFLIFNYHPAKVFMGDTGSFALGGLLVSFAILTKTELLLIVIGGLYVVETLSVIIQVIYFKLTRGKRIFKMSPIHHHFELSGWSELQVVWFFWLISGILGVVGLFGLPSLG